MNERTSRWQSPAFDSAVSFLFKKNYLFILFMYLAAPGLSCGMQTLRCSRFPTRPPALGMRNLSHWTTREVLGHLFECCPLCDQENGVSSSLVFVFGHMERQMGSSLIRDGSWAP